MHRDIAFMPRRSLLCIAMAGILTTAPAQALDLVGDVWIKPDAALDIRVSDAPLDLTQMRVMIGNADYTALFQQSAPGVLQFKPGTLALPPGERELRVIRPGPDGEEVLHSQPLKVLTASGFQEAEFTPSLSTQLNSQFDESHKGSAQPPERRTFEDIDTTAGWTSRHTKGAWEFTTEGNAQGFSHRRKALRFAELGEDAPHFDLSDYRINLSNVGGEDDMGMRLGHISYGNNPLILDNAATRGIAGRYRINDRLDISAASMNGTGIVGWDNPLGLDDDQHRISGITAGVEAFPSRPGALRLEVVYMDASLENEQDFGFGEVTDAEKNDGWGYTLSGSTEEGTLSGSYSWARSRYTNPADPFLDQGLNTQDVITTQNDAERLNLRYEAISGWTLEGFENWPLSLSMDYRHDRADPLFKAVSSSAQADVKSAAWRVSTLIGPVALDFGRTDSEDNLDNAPTVLKTGTDVSDISLSVPLKVMAGMWSEDEPEGPIWLPDLSFTYGETHQRGLNQPVDFAAGHVPDQFDHQWSADARWSGERWGFSTNYSVSEQDNRQPGRENSDFANRTLSVSVDLRPTDSLNLNLGHSLGNQRNDDQDLNSFSHGWNAGINWAFAPRWNFSGSYSLNENDDSQGLTSGRSFSASTRLSREFKLQAFGQPLPGQWYLAHNLTRNRSEDTLFGFTDDGQNWTLQLGVSLTWF